MNQDKYGCFNKVRLVAYPVPDGYVYSMVPNSVTRVPKIIQHTDLMSKDCRYDLNYKDPQCVGCRHLARD